MRKDLGLALSLVYYGLSLSGLENVKVGTRRYKYMPQPGD